MSIIKIINISVLLLAFNLNVFADDIPPIDCMIEPNAIVELSSPVSGVIETLIVDRSDEVKKGQIIGTLNSDIERVAVKTSQEKLKLITIENKRARDLYRDKVITLSDKDKSDNEKKLMELDLQNAQAKLDKLKIRSPIDGQVVKRYSNPGEFVETNPILKLAQLDPLKIEVVSPISNFGKIVKGMTAKIVPEFGVYNDLYAKVIIVDKVIDAASGTFGVRLELENKNYAVPGGLKCKVKFIPAKEVPNIVKNEPSTEVLKVERLSNNVVEAPAKQAFIKEKLNIAISNEDKAIDCSTIGPYRKKSSVNNFLDKFKNHIINKNLRTETAIENLYQINGNIFDTSSKVLAEVNKMKADGVKDVSVVKYNDNFRISLGLYRKKYSADKRLKSLLDKNYSVSLNVINKKVKKYWLDMIYLPHSGDHIKTITSKKYINSCSSTLKSKLIK